MIRPALSFRRRAAVGIVAIGVAAVAPLTTTLQAGATPGSALGAVNVHAVAVGLRIPFYEHQGEDAQAEIPYAMSDLGGGGVAHALTTFFWPGGTGASLGSTLGVLAQGKIPQNVLDMLNDPFKAEAPTTQGDEKVSLSQPGFIMQALAQPTHVNSSSALGLSNLANFKNNAGPLVSSTTNIAFKGADTVVGDASSTLTDIAVGPLSIGSLVSAVHATSNGKHATGTATTNIVGAKIAGVPVILGHDGIELAGQSALPASVVKTLNKTVNSALAAAGLKIYVTKSSKLAHGAEVSLQSGELIVMLNKAGYKSGANDTGLVLELGGASITANATGGYVAPVLPTPSSSTLPTSGSDSTTGSQPLPDTSTGTMVTSPPNPPAPVVAEKPLSMPGPLSSWWVVLGVALAVLFSYLMSLLPGRAFAAAAAGCRLEEES
ncbi:MAG TPA: hypothetical protein VHD81_07270 [Mycobacteriales bacterium]|nr:hypothetical protein [Mycobacteriales bacterium]